MPDNPHILIVDDDKRIVQLLQTFFQNHGYFVSTAYNGAAALDVLQYFVFDLLILDVMMPVMNGIELTKTIKRLQSVPIILLTAMSEPENRILGLETGCDDYIPKPFEPMELLLRSRKLISLYNMAQTEQSMIRFGSNTYNPITKELTRDNNTIHLSSTEQKLLEILLQHKGNVVSRESLSSLMGGLNHRSIDVQITRLRNKIENTRMPRHLQTIRNEGYVLYI